jgi:hypothetical protein
LANNWCGPGRQLEQIIARRIADEVKQSSLRSAVIRWRELEESAYWLELLIEGEIVSPEKLAALRQECDELIDDLCYNRAARKRDFLILPSSLYLAVAV